MDRSTLRRDAWLAAALALALGIGWTLAGWAPLSAMHLPDTDDAMRLQQVRDWLGGQRFADLTQYRLGAGVPMHWSRLGDLGPAVLILALRLSFGPHAAELAAVIVWPLLLFATALFLVARIARALGSPAGTATVIAAIAYPATTVFLPGRIDHHGLQVVLLLAAVAALLRPTGSDRSGMATGLSIALCAVASLVVGLETVPFFAIIGGVAVIAWVAGDDRGRLLGIGAGAVVSLLVARLILAPEAFGWPACDGFTRDAWRAAMVGAAGAASLGVAGRWLAAPRARLAAAVIVGGAVAIVALHVSPRCLSPYGAVDPRLGRLWLARVGEAQPLFHADPVSAIGYVGLLVAGIAATSWRWRATRAPGWAVMLLLLLGSFAVCCVQLRGAYAGAMLAAPGLAALVEAARRRGGAALAGAWIASAGMLYPIAAQALARGASGGTGDGACTGTPLVARLAALPRGVVMAPIDAGPYLIAATPHRLVAGPYHRGGAGDLAMFAVYGGGPARALAVARSWRVDYVLACDGMPGGHDSLAAALRGRTPPPGLAPLYRAPDGAAIYRMPR